MLQDDSPSPVSSRSTAVLSQLKSGQLLRVDPNRQGGLILCKAHHAEFAGPGAAVGGMFDLDCVRTIAVGDVALIYPASHQERQQAYRQRQEWFNSIQQPLMELVPLHRAQKILHLFAQSFDGKTVANLPSEALAMLVGVFPHTIAMAKQSLKQHAAPQQPLAISRSLS